MRVIKKDSQDVSVELLIVSSTDGTPKTDITHASAGLTFDYRRGIAAQVAITASTTPALTTLAATTTAHTDWGIKHIANGRYRVDLPDAAFATGSDEVHVGGAVTGGVVLPICIQLVAYDPQDAVRLGQTALPNAAADAAGGLPISDAGGLDLDGLNTTVGTINTNLTTVDGIVDSILEDTGTTLPATLATIDGIVDDILVDTGTTLPATLATIDGIVDDILVDTGTTLPATLTTIDTVVDTILVDTDATIPGLINALNDFNPSSDTVANVTNVATCASNTDMRGTDSAATAAAMTTAQGNITSILEDTATTLPATLATIDGIVDDILADTGTTIPATLTNIYANTNTDIPSTLSTINTNTSGTSTSINTLTSNLAVVDNNVDSILTGVTTNIPTSLAAILEDTQTTLDDKIDNLTTNLTATDTVVDQIRVNTNTDLPTLINALNDFNPSTDTVANVTTVGTCTTNSDMRGTDNAALATAVSTLASAVTVIDGLVDDIKAAVITTLPGLLATIDTVVDSTL